MAPPVGEVTQRKKAVRRNGLFKRGNKYFLRKRINGNLYQLPLHCENLKDARIVYDQVIKEIALGLHGLAQAPTLNAVVDGWAELHRKQEAHVKAGKWCRDALGTLAKLPLSSITTARVEGWISAYQENHSPATINQVLRYLKLWLRWAVDRTDIPGMPCKIKMLKVEKRVRPVIKVPQLDAFLNAVDLELVKKNGEQVMADLQVRAAVRLMVGLGLRESEVLGARWEWLDQGRGEYTAGKTKGKRPRTLGVPQWVLSVLLQLPRTVSGLIFPRPDGEAHRHNWLRKALIRGAKGVGVVGAVGNHRLRATFATMHNAVGTSLSEIQVMMGHKYISTTRDYIEDDLDQQKASQERLAVRLNIGG